MRPIRRATARCQPDSRLVWFIALAILVHCAAPPSPHWSAQAQQPSGELPSVAETSTTPRVSDNLAAALQKRGDLTLRNSTLEGALYTIGELWKINVVTGAIEGEVNGVFRDAPLREILDSILISNGYSYRAVGDSLVISRFEELGQVNPFFESATIEVQVANVQEVVEAAQLLITPQGQVRSLASARSLFVLDYPDRVALVEKFVASVDAATVSAGTSVGGAPQRLEVGYFRTQFITAEAARTALAAILSKDGRLQSIEQEDRLLMVDYAVNLDMAERVLQQVDRPRPQVRITALIYDISLQDVETLGINWGSALKGRPDEEGNAQSVFDIDSLMQVPFQSGTTGGALSFMNLSRHVDINAVLLALQSASDARLLADPHVVVMENEEAEFQSVSEIPFQQLTQTQQGGQIGTTAFKTAGITLRVQPKVSGDGTIEMIVRPEFSRLTGFTPGDNQPIIDRRAANTTLRVANRQLVVIGGLRQRSDIGDFNGVPHLKDSRLFGKLFRSRSTDVRESELVVFIMPEIVGYAPSLNCRETRVADTIGCRLEHIPAGEMVGPGCQPTLALEVPAGYPQPVTGLPTDGPDGVPLVRRPRSRPRDGKPIRISANRTDFDSGYAASPAAAPVRGDRAAAAAGKPSDAPTSIWKRLWR